MKKLNTLFVFMVSVILSISFFIYIFLFDNRAISGIFNWSFGNKIIPVFSIFFIQCIPALMYFISKKTLKKVSSIITLIASSFVIILTTTIFCFIIVSSTKLTASKNLINLINPIQGVKVTDTKDNNFKIAVSADAHIGSNTSQLDITKKIMSIIKSKPYDAFFLCGDLVEYGTFNDSWVTGMEIIGNEIPVRLIEGNHDSLIKGDSHYRQYFYPDSFISNSLSPYYYAMKCGDAVFIVLDLLWGSETLDKAQIVWLEKNLKSLPPEMQVVVFTHGFIFSSGYMYEDKPWYDNQELIKTLSPIFEKYGVDLVVSGHNHYMEYLQHNGVSYAVIGAMGGLKDPPPEYKSPASIWQKTGSFGYLEIIQKSNMLQLTYIDENNNPLYSTEIKH